MQPTLTELLLWAKGCGSCPANSLPLLNSLSTSPCNRRGQDSISLKVAELGVEPCFPSLVSWLKGLKEILAEKVKYWLIQLKIPGVKASSTARSSSSNNMIRTLASPQLHFLCVGFVSQESSSCMAASENPEPKILTAQWLQQLLKGGFKLLSLCTSLSEKPQGSVSLG